MEDVGPEVPKSSTDQQGLVKEVLSNASPKPPSPNNVISYRDKVIQLNGHKYYSEEEEEEWMEALRREEEEEEMEEVEGEDDPLCPTYRVPKAQHKEDCAQWRKAIIIKLLGRRINSKFMMMRLEKLWNLNDAYELITLDNGHLLLRFNDDRDYTHVLQDGPWVVTGHYLVVQRWRPLFDQYDEEVRKMAVWLRIPGLPIELYSRQHLWQIGNLFGKTIKVDSSSLKRNEVGEKDRTEKARFARICVEVDLRRSFLSKFDYKGKMYQVGY